MMDSGLKIAGMTNIGEHSSSIVRHPGESRGPGVGTRYQL